MFVQVLRKTLDSFGLNATEIVAADKKFEIASDILSDKELAEAVSIIGWGRWWFCDFTTICPRTGVIIQELTVMLML